MFLDFLKSGEKNFKVKVEVSARHVHLCKEDLKKLFGEGYELKKMRDLSQKGEFAAKETVDLRTKKNILKKVRIIGPIRKQTQVELSMTDGFFMGLELPLRVSGNVENTPGIEIIGPKGKIKAETGVIAAKRHLHCSEAQAARLGLKNGEAVKLQIGGERGLIFENVIIRTDANFDLSFQIDTDEANAAGINSENCTGIVIKSNI